MFGCVDRDELHKTKAEKYKPFEGKYVFLEKLNKVDIEPLYKKIHGSSELEQVWQFLPYGPFKNSCEMGMFYSTYLRSNDKLIFCAHEKDSESPIGITCLEEINLYMATVEIASVLYCKSHQKTEANTETVYMLIRHCIEYLGYRRIA